MHLHVCAPSMHVQERCLLFIRQRPKSFRLATDIGSSGRFKRNVAAAAGKKSGGKGGGKAGKNSKSGGSRGGGMRKEEAPLTEKESSSARATSSASREPLLVCEDLSKSHDGDTQLFTNVSFTISRGDRLAFVGPNGSGAATPLAQQLRVPHVALAMARVTGSSNSQTTTGDVSL